MVGLAFENANVVSGLENGALGVVERALGLALCVLRVRKFLARVDDAGVAARVVPGAPVPVAIVYGRAGRTPAVEEATAAFALVACGGGGWRRGLADGLALGEQGAFARVRVAVLELGVVVEHGVVCLLGAE